MPTLDTTAPSIIIEDKTAEEEYIIPSIGNFMVDEINIISDCSGDGMIMHYNATVMAKIEFRCQKHRNIQSVLRINTQGLGVDNIDALRTSIQRLMNHEYYPAREIYDSICDCSFRKGKINYSFNNLKSPFRELFEELFKDANWSLPKLID